MKLFNEPVDPQDLVDEINEGGVRSAILYPLDYHNRVCVIDVEDAYPSRNLYYCTEVTEEDYKTFDKIDNSQVCKDAPDGIWQYWDDMDQKYNPIEREVNL